jgi:hypothetical protein
VSRLWACLTLAVAVLAAAAVRAEEGRVQIRQGALLDDDRPAAARDQQPAAYGWADALVAERRAQGKAWWLDVGFSAYPPQGHVDGPGAKRQPEAR